MTDDQITALAREYGKYVANSLDYDMSYDPELQHKLVVKGHSEAAQSVLEWLLRRFALVEKSKVESTYNRIWNEWNFSLDAENKANSKFILSALESLFPDLTWDSEPEQVEIQIKRKKK